MKRKKVKKYNAAVEAAKSRAFKMLVGFKTNNVVESKKRYGKKDRRKNKIKNYDF